MIITMLLAFAIGSWNWRALHSPPGAPGYQWVSQLPKQAQVTKHLKPTSKHNSKNFSVAIS